MITINETNFPDANFRNWLLAQDYGKDGVLTEEAIKGITEIDVSRQDISSLKGIEHFTALKKLDCSFNGLTTLDVSGCTALTELRCFLNKLTDLNLSGCTALKVLFCAQNNLTSLDLSGCTALKKLYCVQNNLTSLDVSGCTALTSIDCFGNKLTTLDLSGCTALTVLDCAINELTNLNVSGCTALTSINCIGNKLTTLDLSGCTALTFLHCYYNQLKGAAMDRLIESLPQKEGYGYLYVHKDKQPHDGNVCTKAQVTAARAKGWEVLVTYDIEEEEWEEYDGCDEQPPLS